MVRIISFLCIVLISLILKSCDGAPPCTRVCFYLDLNDKGCKVSIYEANTSIMRLDMFTLEHGNGQEPSKYTYRKSAQGTPIAGIEKRVKGEEINYGFWTKNSFHDLSYWGIFYKKWNRRATEQEIAEMTDQNARDWFNDSFKSGGALNVDPVNISTYERNIGKICTDLFTSNLGYYVGNITFSDGTICNIERNGMDLSQAGSDCPASIGAKIKKPCTKCN